MEIPLEFVGMICVSVCMCVHVRMCARVCVSVCQCVHVHVCHTSVATCTYLLYVYKEKS